MFASWTASSLARSLASADPDLSGGKAPAQPSNGSRQAPGAEPKAYDPTRLAKLEDTLKRYEDHFGRHLRILMDRLVFWLTSNPFPISLTGF